MKKLLLFIVTVSIAIISCNKPSKSEQIQRVKLQADSMCMALKNVNVELLFKYSHPLFIAVKKGKDEMASNIKKAREEMGNHNIFIQSITVGEPTNFFQDKKNVQCILPKTVVIKTSNMIIHNNSVLIAISSDYGKNWQFIDGEGKKPDQLISDYPIISSKLTIPNPSSSSEIK
jgi:hypothetical protein